MGQTLAHVPAELQLLEQLALLTTRQSVPVVLMGIRKAGTFVTQTLAHVPAELQLLEQLALLTTRKSVTVVMMGIRKTGTLVKQAPLWKLPKRLPLWKSL